MMEALVEGQPTAKQVAELAQKQAKKKIPQIQAALEGYRMREAQRTLIRFSMGHLAFLEDQIAQLDEQIFRHIERCGFQRAHALLQTVPGIKKQAAAAILAEVGMEMGVLGHAAVPGLASVRATMRAPENVSERQCYVVIHGYAPRLIEAPGVPLTKPAHSFRRGTSDWRRASVTNEQLLPWHTAWFWCSLRC